MRKLVIGCGYLGRRVAEAWLQDGHRVAALTRSPRHAERFRKSGIKPVLGDVTDEQTLSALPPADTVLYAVGYDRRGEQSQREIYVAGLQNVLDEVAPRLGRLLYVSSTSVYGQIDGRWVDESTECNPTSSNGRVCLDAEQVVWRHFPAADATTQRGANVLRLAGLYGPGRLLQRVESLKAGAVLAGNPDAYLNLIHVDDAVRAIIACQSHGHPGQTYLVCDDRPRARREYYDTLATLVGAPTPTFGPAAGSEPRLKGLNKRCSNRRLREELGVELAYPTIETGLMHALRDGGGSSLP